ncbi:hypothetical protein A3I57_01945 [Candidatus Beckwithbacteria bacterium RIFCSPLOWO2_02_FULL_47_23]|uniref:Uncharacterized protein n=1 Tax=Candidatus Beckwithbacteria bacterium RIFCSPLOWO2_02_FULL_47_23 TaxID=1797463 RepID=A0A1F5DW31_9BACT|nr:MAG: hypothetical protein A3I57_01945 [Candidatus Beckwithbacteria bacterium RIFCSPLOWO2_02_FULL_47_23]
MLKKDKSSLLKVLSGICGNLSAGWFGIILITPGFEIAFNSNYWAILTQSIGFGILFLWLAFELERSSL